jgi:superfamily II DNA or RNA helicase
MPTGKGKTVVALWLAAQLNTTRTLVVVHRKGLKDQWTARIAAFCPHAAIDVAMVQSLSRHGTPTEYGLAIYDEAHHMSARTFCAVMLKVRAPYALGLSATPVRADGMHRAIWLFFGEPTAGVLGMNLRAEVARCPLPDLGVAEHRVFNKAMGRVTVNTARLMSDLAACVPRTALIIETITSLVRGNRSVLVLSHRRAHCTAIATALLESDIRVSVCLGGATVQLRPDFQVIVGTTAAVAEGFDEPKLDTLVLATPMASVTQAVGRILRQRNDLPPLVVDFVDPTTTCLRQWTRRRADYTRLGHTLTTAVAMDKTPKTRVASPSS